MALQTSGPISIQDIATEFGLSLPVSMSQLYGLSDGIPTSGPISLTDFYGSSSVPPLTVTVSPSSITGNAPATAFPVGGVSPYTYLWANISSNVVIANNPNSRSTSFGGFPSTARFVCRVTDSNGNTAISNEVVVST